MDVRQPAGSPCVAEAFHDRTIAGIQGDVTRALALYRRSLLLNPYHETVHRKISMSYPLPPGNARTFARTMKHTSANCRTNWAQPEACTTSLYKTLHVGQAVQIEAPGLLETHTQLALPQADPDSSAQGLCRAGGRTCPDA